MGATLTGPYRINRLTVPGQFFTVVSENDMLGVPTGTVLCPTDDHDTPGYVTLGLVSRQTPFGQGTYMGFRQKDVRTASSDEVLRALRRKHPDGRFFRPTCLELLNINSHLLMSGAVSNWTNDSGGESILNTSRGQIKGLAAEYEARYKRILRWWRITTWLQRRNIRARFRF